MWVDIDVVHFQAGDRQIHVSLIWDMNLHFLVLFFSCQNTTLSKFQFRVSDYCESFNWKSLCPWTITDDQGHTHQQPITTLHWSLICKTEMFQQKKTDDMNIHRLFEDDKWIFLYSMFHNKEIRKVSVMLEQHRNFVHRYYTLTLEIISIK